MAVRGTQQDYRARKGVTAPYLSTPEEWQRVADHAAKVGKMGLDTETYGHVVTDTSPAYRAVVHVWSIAFLTPRTGPRGNRLAKGAVLPRAALDYQPIRDMLESPSLLVVAHNVRHDQHALANIGIDLAKTQIRDTLDLARLVWPERSMDMRLGFRLKPMARDLLGKPDRDSYKKLITDEELMVTYKETKTCVCGVTGCKKRKEPDHAKLLGRTEVRKTRKIIYALENIIPGHKRWAALLDYAAEDAVDALELDDLATRRLAWMEGLRPPLPW